MGKTLSPKKLKRMGENRRHMLERTRDPDLLEIAQDYQKQGHIPSLENMNRAMLIDFILAVESIDPEIHWGDLT